VWRHHFCLNSCRPKSVSQWSALDVQKWLRRHCGDYYHLYSEAFLEQDITGKKNWLFDKNSLLTKSGLSHRWVDCKKNLFAVLWERDLFFFHQFANKFYNNVNSWHQGFPWPSNESKAFFLSDTFVEVKDFLQIEKKLKRYKHIL